MTTFYTVLLDALSVIAGGTGVAIVALLPSISLLGVGFILFSVVEPALRRWKK